jgi:hypothetical protein
MTPEQRRSAIDFGKFCGTGMPIPTGHLAVAQRAHILNLYYETTVAAPFYNWRNKNLVATGWDSRVSPSSSWNSRQTPVSGWNEKKSPSSSWTEKVSPVTPWTEKTSPPDGSTQVI